MRHAKHRHILGVKTAHRAALLSNLSAALLRHGKIQTTLAKAKALRPFVEKVITMAKKAHQSGDRVKALHYRRLALSKVRDKDVIHQLFHERVTEFLERNGGYTRIYKLTPRIGDGAPMAIIELIPAGDEGYTRRKKPARKTAKVSQAVRGEDAGDEGSEVEETPESAEPEAVEPEAGSEEEKKD